MVLTKNQLLVSLIFFLLFIFCFTDFCSLLFLSFVYFFLRLKLKSLIGELFLCSYIIILCYEFLSKHCFTCIPQILIQYVLTFAQNVVNSSDPGAILKCVYLVSKYLGIFPAIFPILVSSLISPLVREKCFVYFQSFCIFEIFSRPRIWSFLVNVPRAFAKNVCSAVAG